MKTHSRWKLFFDPPNLIVAFVTVLIGVLAWLAEPGITAAYSSAADLRPWLDSSWSPGVVMVAIAVVGLAVAYALTAWRYIDRHRPTVYQQLYMRAAANMSKIWKSLLAIGHATTAMLGAALPAFRHRSAPMLS